MSRNPEPRFQIIPRTVKDATFRHALMNNPKEAIQKELGEKIPDEIEITVLKETTLNCTWYCH